uniref:Neprosin PEP catalytic domain-containing protein n=1 Tax=Chenopodium quinoa TaxID=63459 RepID=A0A803L9D9_CHEQI
MGENTGEQEVVVEKSGCQGREEGALIEGQQATSKRGERDSCVVSAVKEALAGGGGGLRGLRGFVQVAKDLPLGTVPPKYSEYGGEQWAWGLSIVKHQDDGNWWLSFSRTKEDIGYWPKELFTSLKEFSNQVEWGGEIYNPELSRPPPEMGNGRRAIYNGRYTAAVIAATYVDESYNNVVNPEDTHKVWECEESYIVKDDGYISEELGRMIYYGGPNNPLML